MRHELRVYVRYLNKFTAEVIGGMLANNVRAPVAIYIRSSSDVCLAARPRQKSEREHMQPPLLLRLFVTPLVLPLLRNSFSGFPEGDNGVREAKIKKMTDSKKWTVAALKDLCTLLGVDKKGDKVMRHFSRVRDDHSCVTRASFVIWYTRATPAIMH